MRLFKTTTVAAALLLFGAAGCADLDVQNPNDPTREQALQSALDVESLIAGGYNTWYNGLHNWVNTFWVSNASFQSVSTAANAGNIDHSGIPRTPIINDPAYADYGSIVERPWQRSYRALAAIADGLGTLLDDPEIQAELDDQAENGALRAQAWARTVQGLAHATLAVWYDQGFIIDETVQTVDESGAPLPLDLVPYTDLMNAAFGYFDQAITLAESGTFTIPSEWASIDITSDELVELVHSWRAVYRASYQRTPSEPVDWPAVVADLDAGITSDFVMDADWTGAWYNGALDVNGGPNGWGAESYFIIGMADQSGDYQAWLNTPLSQRTAWFGAQQDDDPFLIETPDLRFAQGTTIADQVADGGPYNARDRFYIIPQNDTYFYDVADHFTNPDRGTWRWSYYYYPTSFYYWFGISFDAPMVTMDELNMLRAEAYMNGAGGTAADAAALINDTRTAYGLNATDASGTNTSCVPRLPDGSCGDLMEMLKWEKRLMTKTAGLFAIGWYWDSRRWGDLYSGTPLQWPVPAQELQFYGMDVYTFGGCGETPPSASDGSSYNYPGEC